MASRARWLWRAVWPLAAPLAIVLAVNAWPPAIPLRHGQTPREPRDPGHCTWVCHNQGCTHAHRLPSVLSGQRGAFGAAVWSLHAAAGPGFKAYRAINLLVFVAGWPALMYALLLSGMAQRDRLRALRDPGQEP